MHNLGYILKSAREDRDLTQTEVMRRTGINNKTLSGYENNIAEPDLTTFARLMKLYQLSADQVLGTGRGDQKFSPAFFKRRRVRQRPKPLAGFGRFRGQCP